MSVESFIPEIVAAEVEVAYNRAAVVAATLTANFDGEVRSGNAVTVVTTELPEVQNYGANGRRFTPDEIDGEPVKILIDQEKLVGQRVDNIDRRQAAGDLNQFTDLQGTALSKDAERHILSTMLAEGVSLNVVGSAPVKVDSPDKAKAAVRTLAAALDTAEAPDEGRWLVVNPAFKTLLVEGLSDYMQSAPLTEDALVRNLVTQLSGFKVIWSPNFDKATVGDKPCAIAYMETAVAHVGQLDEVRAVQATDSHSDIISSLRVYGTKTLNANGVQIFLSEGTPAA